MKRTLGTMTLVVVAGLVTPVAAASEPAVAWQACPASVGPVDARQECATVRVPLDYRQPGGERIPVAVSRIRTARPELRRGVLLLVPGGPGNAGLARPTTHGLRLPREVLDRYDLVGFDPRGVGHSAPVSCGLEPRDLEPTAFLPWPGPGGDTSAATGRAERIARACARNGGAVLRSISTRNEARDVDRIRRALGESRLSVWGTSYGTYVGAVYATMFPRRTDRVVLDSNGDPDPRRVARGWLANFAAGAEDRFPDFAAWAAARDASYGLGSTPAAVRATYLRLAGELDRDPRPDVTGATLRAVVFNSLYADASFPQAAAFLRAALTGGPVPPIPAPPADQFQNLVSAQVATACNDVAWPGAEHDYAGDVARDRAAHPLTDGMPANVQPCAFWPRRPTERPTLVTADGPGDILLVQNRRDPATPLTGALRMREALGDRARMVVVESGGHGAYVANGNACGDRVVTDFLTGATRPGRDVTCP
ncbi:alpha/beta hydrolase [Saccharothrix luteola]|uniref:alpha/beta hydrolase n=1 Tax=Saccharothrix luteola TaxID=2893018 RepID=UPI001E325FDF|nr:alpha/beta hydrolase [Saccharothrix luteola]MCC8250031.1 alpha/beta hydrolase [Saccharothrix luteola]